MSGMDHSHRRSCLLLSLAASLLCLTAAFPAPAGAKSCKASQIAIAFKPRGRAKAKQWCLPRPRIPRSQADAAVAIVRLLEEGKLSPKRLERLVGHLPAAKERAFRRDREREVRRAASVAHGARLAQVSHDAGNIAPGPGQAGFGYFTESSSSSTAEDAEHATVRTTHTSRSRHEVFGPKCPDFDGTVVTKINVVHTDIRSTERRGKRTTITTDARISGTLTGGFTDDFEFRGPLQLDLDFVIETRVVTVIAATGKVVDRKPTATRRVRMTTSIAPEALGALQTPADAFSSMTITGAGGPHGTLALDDFLGDPPLVLALMGSVALAKTEAAAGFAKTVDNATGFGCVAATADPASLTLASGESGSFTVTERGLDDQRALPSSSNVRVYAGNLTLSPVGNKIHGPASGIAFQATSGGGASVAEVGTVSRRGYSPTLKIPISERRSIFPARFIGTWTRVYSDVAGSPGMVQTIQGSATFVRNPLIPPEAEAMHRHPLRHSEQHDHVDRDGLPHRGGLHDDLQRIGHRHGDPEHVRRHGHDAPGRQGQPGRPGAGADALLLLDPRQLGPGGPPAVHHYAQRRSRLQRRQPGADHRRLPRDRRPRRSEPDHAARRDPQER